MITTSEEQRNILREGGKRLARIRRRVINHTEVGMRTDEINDYAHDLLTLDGDRPAFLNYQPQGAPRPFPASICLSVNDEVVHGIPTENPQNLAEGDVVSIDLGLVHKGLITDTTATIIVGEADPRVEKLVACVYEALDRAIDKVRPGVKTGTISSAIEETIRSYGFGAPSEFGGHGVGMDVHESPSIPNVGTPNAGMKLEEGMVIAIEPIATLGDERVVFDRDGYTVRTKNGLPSAQAEHTVLVTHRGAEILTD